VLDKAAGFADDLFTMPDDLPEGGADGLLSPQQVLIESPLYSLVPYSKIRGGSSWFKGGGSLVVDCFCTGCEQESVFRSVGLRQAFKDEVVIRMPHLMMCMCMRNPEHALHFLLDISTNGVMKVGQWPSYANLQAGELKKHRKALASIDYEELVKAYGLASHDSAIGAFTYLRRIFQRVIEATHLQAQGGSGWNEEEYRNARMADQIRLLHGYLPDFVTKNALLWKVLSKGIHELSEDECRDHFPFLKNALELILDQNIARKEQQRKTADTEKALSQIASKHKSEHE
jgi:hypothetical protein